jgi:O-antigen/teichoic acid export membrane protein
VAARAALVSLLGQGGTQGLRLVGNLILSRLLFPEAFGLMAIVRLVQSTLQMISDVGIQASVIRHERGDESSFLDTAWTIQVIRGAGLWLLAVAAALPLANFYEQRELALLIAVAASTAFIRGFQSTKVMTLVRKIALERVMLIDFSSRLIGVIAMISLALIKPSVWVLVVGALVAASVRTLLTHRALPGKRNHFGWDRMAARDIISFGKWILLGTSIGFLAARLDVVLLGKLLPMDMLGVYSIGIMITGVPRMVIFRVSRLVLEPVFAAANLESRERLAKTFGLSRSLLLPLGLVAMVGVAAASPAFFIFLYDERYHDAGWIAQLSMIPLWFGFLQQSSSRALTAVGDSRAIAASNLVRLVATTAGCLGGYQLGGLPGLIIGMALGTLCSHVTVTLFLRSHGLGGLQLDVMYSLLGLLLGLAAAFAPQLAPQPTDPRIAPLITLGAGTILLAPLGLWVGLRVKRTLRK